MNIETALKEAITMDGAVGASVVDWDSGMSLGALGGGKYLDLDVAAAGNTEVVRAKMRTMESLRLNDNIEDILITLNKQYHLIRLLRSPRSEQGSFLYLVLDRQKANLALARHNLRQIGPTSPSDRPIGPDHPTGHCHNRAISVNRMRGGTLPKTKSLRPGQFRREHCHSDMGQSAARCTPGPGVTGVQPPRHAPTVRAAAARA